ncbi:MAG: LysR family transcriptional regulator [Bdellovibrionales bacterium]|nr:LysR family transcriptional regulator [Bdellovibrionales bacterium]
MKLNIMDLNRLKCFQAVAEKGSLQDGARHLNLTTSAVYQSIKKLELETQKHLFFRSGKKYILTDEGRELQELFQRFLWDISQFQNQDRVTSDSLNGEIRVGLPLNFSKSVFIPLVKSFHAEYPNVRFHITIAETRRLLNQVAAFELDFAITDDAIPAEFLSKVARQEVFKEELVLVCSRSFYKKNESKFKSVKTMKDLPHLDYSKNLPLLQRWYKLHYKRQIKISDFHTIDNVETMVVALKEGMGLGVIPRDLYDNPVLTKELHAVEAVTGSLFNLLFLVQEENYINNTLMKKFLLYLNTSLKK